MKETIEHWLTEFGPDYQIPDIISKADDSIDKSWHNDACPSFWVGPAFKRGESLWRCEVWAEHPNDTERGSARGALRFTLVLAEVEEGGEQYTGNADEVASSDSAEWIMQAAREIYTGKAVIPKANL